MSSLIGLFDIPSSETDASAFGGVDEFFFGWWIKSTAHPYLEVSCFNMVSIVMALLLSDLRRVRESLVEGIDHHVRGTKLLYLAGDKSYPRLGGQRCASDTEVVRDAGRCNTREISSRD